MPIYVPTTDAVAEGNPTGFWPTYGPTFPGFPQKSTGNTGDGGGDSGNGDGTGPVIIPALPPAPPLSDPRRVWLEATNASWTPGLNAIILPGMTGLRMPPQDLVTASTPGVTGTTLQEVKIGQREVFLPVHLSSDVDPVSFLEALATFEELAITADSLRLVADAHRGPRELGIVYADGLQGDEGQTVTGSMWCRLGLKFIAPDPWWRDREDQSVEFRVASPANAFIGRAGDTDAPWPGMLGPSVVIGQSMRVLVRSAIPVDPTIELTGPMDSFTGSMDTGWSVSVPDGVPAGKTLRIVSDPRVRSIRLSGDLAAGRVARGSKLVPFSPGYNTLNVLAPGATEETLLRLSWRGGWRTAWGS